MPKEWILNSAMNRFQLNFKRNVGSTSESIRKCAPKTLNEWREYYFSQVRPEEHIVELGKKLYVKITEVIEAEVAEVTEEDCISYMKQLVINRTFDGYMTEIQTVYGQLEQLLNVKIQPAPDEWDRIYNVDFFIKARESFIGLQIKPITFKGGAVQLPEIFKEKSIQEKSHKKFMEKYGGKVFYIYSFKSNRKKEIYNKDVIDQIRNELTRLGVK
ncbi:MjaI family restriction endonuclease [Prosthecochloris sp. SCSIO W1101]|uniref:MjaI family restriction endonuclease n=1 Tax=Prosthecochloris sp. SCSIO W1101 TaxID=2992242 RepID=UPI00223D594E|nr:MjaI family restriction endonuclease [Prosthecochloris sp. SCSIO W1101]UZJ41488.1 MjaI family restriction endonuclease [Prosthecochloris sp. SCSIO W1101]